MKLVKEIEDFYRSRQADGAIPLHEPEFDQVDEGYVLDCIQSGWVSSVGKYVTQAENDIQTFVGSAGAVATVNGTAALHLSLLALEVCQGDEVLVPSLTFVATTNAIHYCHAVPHFIDVEEQQLGICPDKLERYLKSVVSIEHGKAVNKHTGRSIKALIYVHLFGFQGDVSRVVDIAHSYGIKVIEDCAESLGTYLPSGKHTGVIGDVSAFSFNGNKIITCGGGGMVVSSDTQILDTVKHLSTTAKQSGEGYFYHDQVGYNYRLPNLNAALLVAQMTHLTKRIQQKQSLFYALKNAISEQRWPCKLMSPITPSCSNHWLLAIRVEASEAQGMLDSLQHAGIMARPLWQLNHTLPMNLDAPKADLSNSEQLVQEVICLPSSAKLAYD